MKLVLEQNEKNQDFLRLRFLVGVAVIVSVLYPTCTEYCTKLTKLLDNYFSKRFSKHLNLHKCFRRRNIPYYLAIHIIFRKKSFPYGTKKKLTEGKRKKEFYFYSFLRINTQLLTIALFCSENRIFILVGQRENDDEGPFYLEI